MRLRDMACFFLALTALGFAACAKGSTDTGEEDDGGTSSSTTGGGPTTGPGTGGSGPSTGPGPGTGGTSSTGGTTSVGGSGTGGAGATGGMGGMGGMGGQGGSGGTCNDWAVGDLGGVGDHSGDIDVKYFAYRDDAGVLYLTVTHTPFDPTTTTSQPGMRIADDGTNLIDMHWSAGAAVFEASTDSGANFTTIAADPNLTMDVSDANVGGTVTYSIPETILATHLTSATVATELFGTPFARAGSTFTDQIATTAHNVRWTSRDQCDFAVASNPETHGDATDSLDYGALSYNAENGMLRLRMDFYAPFAVGTQEAQVYVYDQSVASGFGIFVLSVYDGDLLFATRDDLFGFWGSFSNAPVACTTVPSDLTAVTDRIVITCPQADIATAVALELGAFVFNGAHVYRAGGLTWTSVGVEDDELPNGWGTAGSYTAFDLIDIP